MQANQFLEDLARLARLLKLDQLVARLNPEQQPPRAETAHPGLDFSSFRTPQAEAPAATPRLTFIILGAAIFGILAGSAYFFHVLNSFKTAILANATEVLGPYPNTAIIYAVFPAFAGLFYALLDYFRAKSGIEPFKSAVGLGVAFILASILYALSGFPGQAVKHQTNQFAAAHGYAKCSSPFDPDHLHVYALISYSSVYGCPTAGPPQ